MRVRVQKWSQQAFHSLHGKTKSSKSQSQIVTTHTLCGLIWLAVSWGTCLKSGLAEEEIDMISLYLYIDHDSETTPGLNIKPRDETMGEIAQYIIWICLYGCPPSPLPLLLPHINNTEEMRHLSNKRKVLSVAVTVNKSYERTQTGYYGIYSSNDNNSTIPKYKEGEGGSKGDGNLGLY